MQGEEGQLVRGGRISEAGRFTEGSQQSHSKFTAAGWIAPLAPRLNCQPVHSFSLSVSRPEWIYKEWIRQSCCAVGVCYICSWPKDCRPAAERNVCLSPPSDLGWRGGAPLLHLWPADSQQASYNTDVYIAVGPT
eukprot:364260-Chlamydomonas_euryale.AAC.10